MKKQLQRKYGGLTALLSAFVLTFLGLGACMNPLQAPAERSPDGSTGVRISIVTGEERTLLPSATFSKYVLSFSSSDGVASHGDITLTANSEIVSLDPADWTITVTAYVDVEGGPEVAAAEGSAEVSLGSGELKGVSIRVSAQVGGGDGYFSYDAQYPADVQYGRLQVYDSVGTPVIDKYLTSESSGNKIPLAAGYYGLRVDLQTSYGVAIRTEIVHIYPGMETRGDYVFSETDFGSPITISGTVDLSGLGAVDMAEIQLYRNFDFTYQESGASTLNPSGAWSWAVRTLPFNQPTDLYMELRLYFSGGGTLIKRLPVPVNVYDQNAAASALGPFTVNQFNLSGVVDFSDLTSLGITINYVQLEVYQNGSSPGSLGSAFVSSEGGPWSFDILTEEASLPVRILLRVQPNNQKIIYDEIQTNLTASRSDLNFKPGPIGAGTPINGASANSGDYWCLFVPGTSGDHVFTLSAAGSQYTYLYLYDALGYELDYAGGWYPDSALSYSLNAGDVYYIRLSLYSPYQIFQFRADPVSQASLGGTVNFSGLLSPFSGGVTISSADITIYAGNSLHTTLGTGPIDPGNGSWSATVDLAGSSAQGVFVIAAELSNSQIVYHQEYLSINGNNSGLNFNATVITGLNPVTRTTMTNNTDSFLYVPAATGHFSLKASADTDHYMFFNLYDAETGFQISSAGGIGGAEMIESLTEGKPYRIWVYSDLVSFQTYQFQAEALQPVILSGTINLSGLAPLTSEDINYTEILILTDSSNPIELGLTLTESNGAWSTTIPASGIRAVRIQAYINLKNGKWIIAQRQATVSGDTTGLDLAPAAVSPTTGQPVSRVSSYYEDLFLLVPSTGGFFNLGAISGIGMSDLNLSLYDAATGAGLAQGVNSLYTSLTAGTPYIVRVDNTGIFAEYQFQLSAITSTISIGGSINNSGLPASIIPLISSATVSSYLEPSHTQIVSGAPVAGNAWSALVPSNAVGQTVRLVLTLNLLNSPAINSQIQTILTGPSTNLDFTPASIASGSIINGKTTSNGEDSLLFVPSTSGDFVLQAESDTWTNINVYDGLTGNHIAGYGSYLSVGITTSLVEENPYIIQVYLNGNNFHDYQFKAEEAPQ
jgi:hypothetical protein